MASVNGVSSSNMTSSLFNSGKIISGLASGLDTEGMIEGLVQSYQLKINQLSQKATKIEWKQDAYRSIIQKMVGFSSKYASYTSSTNLASPSFFSNAVKVLTKGTYKDSVSASGKTSSDIQLNAVHQLAQAASYRTKSNMATGTTGIIAGKSMDLFAEDQIELSNLSGGLTLTYGSKSVSISFSESGDVEAMKDIRAKLAKDQNVAEADVKDADVLAGLINQKLADEKITFNSGNTESADQRIKAVANSDGSISITELGTAKNGVYISGASGNIAEKLGLSKDDLENAKDKKPTTLKLQTNYDEGGLTRKLSGIEYLAEKSKAGATTMNMNLDGSTKQIKLPQVKVEEKENEDGTKYKEYYLDGKKVEASDGKTAEENFVSQYVSSLQKSVKDAFGDKVSVENKATDGSLQLEFKVKNEGSDLVINSDMGEAMGIGKSATSYLSTGKTLGDLLGDKLNGLTPSKDKDGNEVTDSKGAPKYDFEINGVVVGSFSKNSTLSDVLSAINASDAGVKAGYSQTTQSFTFTSKETGADSRVEFGKGLAQTMFFEPMDTKTTMQEILGDDYSYGDVSSELEMNIGGKNIRVAVPLDKSSFKDVSMEELTSYVNGQLSGFGMKATFDRGTNSISVVDQDGKKVDVEYKDDLSKAIFAATAKKAGGTYTAGQDAKFTVTVNGEQKTMTRSSNNVNIDGLTISMQEEFDGSYDQDGNQSVDSAGKPVYKNSVTFQTKTDSDKIVDAIKEMAAEYNIMMAEIKGAYSTMPYQKSSGAFGDYEPLTDDDRASMSESAIERYEEKAKQGILFGDRNLSRLYTNMSQVFSFANTRDTDTLKDMGLELNYSITDGAQTLTVDEDKLRAYLDSDPDRAAELFTKSDGIMDRMKKQLDDYAKTTGEPKGILIQQAGSPLSSLSLLNNQWQQEIDNVNTQIEKWQDKLTAQVEKYTSQFSRLEQLINQMNSQSSTLAGLMGG